MPLTQKTLGKDWDLDVIPLFTLRWGVMVVSAPSQVMGSGVVLIHGNGSKGKVDVAWSQEERPSLIPGHGAVPERPLGVAVTAPVIDSLERVAWL